MAKKQHSARKVYAEEFQDGVKTWMPSLCLQQGGRLFRNEVARRASALVILNQPIENIDSFSSIAQKPDIHYVVAADGGANRIYDLHQKEPNAVMPWLNAICGDLDSIRPEVLEHYQEAQVQIIQDKDQYATDLMKALRLVSLKRAWILEQRNRYRHRQEVQASIVDIILYGGLGGRADQALSLLHHLYHAAQDQSITNGDIYLITPESFIFLLDKGDNSIIIPVAEDYFTENVGIVPLSKPAVITTSGLEWDVTNWRTEFGTQISTSNHIKSPVIRVNTTERVLFTLELTPMYRPGHGHHGHIAEKSSHSEHIEQETKAHPETAPSILERLEKIEEQNRKIEERLEKVSMANGM